MKKLLEWIIVYRIKEILKVKEKRAAGIVTLIISLVIVTPLCGFLFQCGCDWPWLGLDSKCNYYQHNIKHQCPWCVSIVIGVLSTGTAIITGVWASTISANILIQQQPIIEIIIRVLFGITLFILVAAMAASFALISKVLSA